jgi:uncharacterized protein (DUF2249 family)/hemerythrin-like domain-containing protein
MANRIGVLDVRTIPHRDRHPEVFRRFDALREGDAILLVNDHEPRGLLHQFQASRPREFEWNVIEGGPETFRVEIERRGDTGPRTVSELLGRDHARLDALFAAARRSAAADALTEAASAFDELAHGLERHIEAEESVLFPAFEKATGATNGPTAVMRAEHVKIRQLLAAGTTALAEGSASRFESSARQLEIVLGQHNGKEEGILYPMTDQAVADDAEREALVRAVQAAGPLAACSHGHAHHHGRRLGTV